MKVAVVGGGLAGAVLGWQLARLGERVELYSEPAVRWRDATGASGGLMRGFETDCEAARLAAESLADLRSDPVLREWAGYQELGSTYLLPQDVDPADINRSVEIVERLLPGSVDVGPVSDQAVFRALPEGTTAVRERLAGYISPARLRGALLADLAARGGVIRPDRVCSVTGEPAIRLADGSIRHRDVVVLATGPWTPGLLARSGLGTQGLRTRQIQFTVGQGGPAGLGAFVDETTGLYGRPVSRGTLLLGLPTVRWQVEPNETIADLSLADRVARVAGRRFGLDTWPGPGGRTVVSLDCYATSGPTGLTLRRCLPGVELHTFTGGGGSAAKSALAAGRDAARTLASV